jgi:Amt family ammonium transporter
VIIGIAAGLIPWFFCYKVKGWFGYDDALDTFGVHAIGGTIGAFLTGMPGAQCGECQPGHQLEGVMLPIQLVPAAGAGTAQGHRPDPGAGDCGHNGHRLCGQGTGGLRPSEEVEVAGLDLADHGEEGYHQAG